MRARKSKPRSKPMSWRWKRRSRPRLRPQSDVVASAPSAPYHTFEIAQGRLLRLARGFRTFHAFHFADYRTDPRPAAADRLARGAVSGGVVADPAAAAVPKPAGGPCDGAGLWPGIPGRNLSRPAAGVLACRYRIPRRRQSCVRRLSAGAALRGRDVPDAVSALARHCRRTTGGARGAADDDGNGIQFARRRVRPAGAGAPAVGAAAAAFLAIDRAGPAHRVVRLVYRGGIAAADDAGRNRPVGADIRIRAGNPART